MAKDKKDFNLTIAPLWKSKFGGYYTMVKDEAFDALQNIEKGGMLVIRTLKEESRSKETSPHAYLEYVTKEKLAAGPSPRQRPAPASSDDV